MSQIRYRINSVTSEHPRYPAQNLLESHDGWQSSYNCSYPQSITIQFFVPIKTKKLHLLFHQYKIPKLVQVFVRIGRQKYRKLGYTIPNDNSQSSYEQKQQKVLYFQFSCTHIRLVIHQNYKNEMNVFNQIALEDINVIGQILSHQEITGIDLTEEDSSDQEFSESVQINHNLRSIDQVNKKPLPNNQTYALFQDIYSKLQQEKQTAVNKEDYQKAAYFKTILSNFKNLQNQISRLEKQKQQALNNQDYDRCHNIKNLIQKKREVVEYQREELYKNEEQFLSHNSFSRIVKTMENDTLVLNESKKKEYYSNQSIGKLKSPQIDKQAMNSSSLYDNQIVPALMNKAKLSEFNLPLQTNEKRKQSFLDVNQSSIPELISENDLSSVKKDISQIRQPTERSNDASVAVQPLKLQPLQNKLKLTVQNYFDFIPERIWQLSEHKSWRGKLQAVKFLKERVDSIQTKQHFMGTLSLISRIIVSKQAVISIEVLQILNRLTDIKLKFSLQSLPFFIEDIIGELLNFLNDTNNKIKQLAYTTYKKLPQISFLNIGVPIRELIKHKNKVKNDPKLIITKIHLMQTIIQKYPQFEYHYKQIANWIIYYMQDPNQQVRRQANQLLVVISLLVGSQKIIKLFADKSHLLEGFLSILNNNSLNSFDHSKANPAENSKIYTNNSKLQQEFYGEQVGKSVKQSNRNASEKPMYILQSEDKKQSSKGSRRQLQSKDIDLSYSKESIYEESAQVSGIQYSNHQEEHTIKLLNEPGICEYCQQPFENQKNHYLYHCNVLASCDRCSGLIYLRQFTKHLLEQCQESHQYKQCKRCGLAFQLDQINEHIGKDICKKKPGLNWQRCQFCGTDVLGEDRYWLQHAKNCNSLPQKNVYGNQQSFQK